MDFSSVSTAVGGATGDIAPIATAILGVLAGLFVYRKVVKTTNKS